MQAPAPIRQHPNASLATGLGSFGVLLVWVAGNLGLSLNAEEASAASGAVTSIGLVIGRRGIIGIVRMIWRGDPGP